MAKTVTSCRHCRRPVVDLYRDAERERRIRIDATDLALAYAVAGRPWEPFHDELRPHAKTCPESRKTWKPRPTPAGKRKHRRRRRRADVSCETLGRELEVYEL